ncbi:MAG: beta-lactamase family protein [Anaerolineae bacterium]|nr:beta-lactamase family protein [Anaerolineae bacterium]
MSIYPDGTWTRALPSDVGLNPGRLAEAEKWLDARAGEGGYRFAVVKDGALVVDLSRGIGRLERLQIASAAKSVYSNVLGIAVEEGMLPSADAPVVDVYPEMMDVPAGEGPKEGRYAFPKDAGITFRQLICNVSGYMKPGEEPGKVFHYQTYGMNVLTHSVAKAYGMYDVADPTGSAGFGQLIKEKLAGVIGADFTYRLTNFKLHEKARLPIFGYYCQVCTTALDLARLGWLWCNWGRWQDQQVVPEAWMRETVAVNPFLIANAPEEQWVYGHGFWTNERGVQWPDLPRDGFTSAGAGGHFVSVFPSQQLVVVQNPAPHGTPRPGATRANGDLLALVLAAVR